MANRNPLRAYKPPHVPNVIGHVSGVAEIAREELLRTAREFAESERFLFVSEIRSQRFPSFEAFPLSASYLAFKARAGLDSRTMIATGHYWKSIKVQERDEGNGKATIHIGFDDRARAQKPDGKSAEILLNDVALIQEKGSRAANIPARNHWRFHLEQMRIRAQSWRALALARVKKRMGEV